MPKKLDIEKKTIAVSMLCEGNSIRGVERMTGIHRDTIMRLGVRVGQGMKKIQDEKYTGLQTTRVEVDEMWGFIGAKQKVAERDMLAGKGDIWTWVAIDADSKLVPSWHVGGRSTDDAHTFIGDLKKRLIKRPQISSDALKAYRIAIEAEFGREVDYGSLVKVYRTQKAGGFTKDHRQSLPEVESVKK